MFAATPQVLLQFLSFFAVVRWHMLFCVLLFFLYVVCVCNHIHFCLWPTNLANFYLPVI